jgi:hypothetical protein
MDNWEGMLTSDISLEEKLKLVLNNFIETAKRSSEYPPPCRTPKDCWTA